MNPQELFENEITDYRVSANNETQSYVNLDNAATTPPFKKVTEEVRRYLTSYGSVHRGAGTKSQVSTNEYEKSRDTIKEFVKADPQSYVIFTGNTTGAMNTAAHFFAQLKGKVAVSSIEHSSSWLPWIKAEGEKALGKKQCELGDLEEQNKKVQECGKKQVIQYDTDEQFEFDLDSIEKILRENEIKIFILTASSNVTGYCPDIKKIGRLVHKYGAYFFVDACQFIQHHPIDMQGMGIDFLAASGHKFYAPFGGGFLIGPKEFLDRFLPYQIGGGNLPYITKDGTFLRYENQLAHDPGTPNAIGAIAMATALKVLQAVGLNNVEQHEKALAKKAYEALKNNSEITLYVPEKHLSTVIPFNIKGKNPFEVAKELNDAYGIGVRAGSFCTYELLRKLLGIKNESAIIEGVRKQIKNSIPGLIRASISLQNTAEDIERFINAIRHITQQ